MQTALLQPWNGIAIVALEGQPRRDVGACRPRSRPTPIRFLYQRWGFSVGANFAARIGRLLWFGPLEGLQKMFFHSPLVYLFVAGSYLYHDFVWHPTIGRRRVRRFLRESPWGALFQRYRREGAGGPLGEASNAAR